MDMDGLEKDLGSALLALKAVRQEARSPLNWDAVTILFRALGDTEHLEVTVLEPMGALWRGRVLGLTADRVKVLTGDGGSALVPAAWLKSAHVKRDGEYSSRRSSS